MPALGLAAAANLYAEDATADEGLLTRAAQSAGQRPFARQRGTSAGVGAWLRLGHGEECSGGRERESLLGDAIEAFWRRLSGWRHESGQDDLLPPLLPTTIPPRRRLAKAAGWIIPKASCRIGCNVRPGRAGLPAGGRRGTLPQETLCSDRLRERPRTSRHSVHTRAPRRAPPRPLWRVWRRTPSRNGISDWR